MSTVFRRRFRSRYQRPFTFTKAAQTVIPASVIASFVIPAATLVLGAVTVNPAPVTATFNIPAPTLVFTVFPAPVTASFNIPAPTLIAGTVTVIPASVTATFNVPTPTFAFGAVTLTLTPVTASFNIPTPILVSNLTITPASVVATFNIPTPTLIGPTITVQPAPVVAAFAIPTPILILGTVTVFPSSVAAIFVIPTPTLIIGTTVSPSPVIANFVIPLAVKIGDRFIVGIGATGAWLNQDNNIATIISLGPTAWSFRIPRVGESLYRLATNESLTWEGNGWQSLTGYGIFRVITATYTANKRHYLQADDDIVGGIITISLPLLSTVKGGYIVKKMGSTSDVVIVGLGGNTIDGVASQTLGAQNESFTFVKGSNTNWNIV